ncbi:MAG: hypothetical protein RLZZ624_945 [Cyanobacteriota bacterium]|jgi:hypothetical protein
MRRPDGAALRALELEARQRGTGLGGSGAASAPHPLTGTWLLAQLWSARGAQPIPLTAALLRSFGACLQLGECQADGRFPLRNRVSLAALRLEFSGFGLLVGKRPLLVFGFDTLALHWGERLLWQRQLPAELEASSLQRSRRQPFFALIALDREEGWLAARGRGGGLALWTLQAASQGVPRQS